MRTVWLLLQVFAARWKSRRNMVGVIVLIIVMISTFCYVKKTDETAESSGKIVLGVAKEDTSEYADLLLRYFNENETFLSYVKLIEADTLVLAVPEKFSENLSRRIRMRQSS